MAEHSPTPWRLVVNPLNGQLLIKESGPGVSLTVGNMFKPADAEFLVEAVNERDRLRDLVRRLANMAETTIPDAMENWDGFTSGRVEFEREAYALIREALGEVAHE